MLYRIKAEAVRWVLISWRTLDSVANAEIILAHKFKKPKKNGTQLAELPPPRNPLKFL